MQLAACRPAGNSPLAAETAALSSAGVTAVAMNQIELSGGMLSDCRSACSAGIAMAALTAAGEPATESGEQQATMDATKMKANGRQQESDVTEITAASGQPDRDMMQPSQCDSSLARELPQAALAPVPSDERQQANSSSSKPGQLSTPKAPAAPPPPPPPKRGPSGHSRAAPKPPSPLRTPGVTAPSPSETEHECCSDADSSGAKPVAHVYSSRGNSQTGSISHDPLISAPSSGKLNLISKADTSP